MWSSMRLEQMKAQEGQGLRTQDRKAFNLVSESFVKFLVWVKTMFAWNFVCATSAHTSPFRLIFLWQFEKLFYYCL